MYIPDRERKHRVGEPVSGGMEVKAQMKGPNRRKCFCADKMAGSGPNRSNAWAFLATIKTVSLFCSAPNVYTHTLSQRDWERYCREYMQTPPVKRPGPYTGQQVQYAWISFRSLHRAQRPQSHISGCYKGGYQLVKSTQVLPIQQWAHSHKKGRCLHHMTNRKHRLPVCQSHTFSFKMSKL